METLRSSMPFRLRQLLSGQGGAPFPSLKESEPPPEIKAFIDRVIKSPLCDIAIPLSGFHWEYCKGNFHHWRPLFLHFDTYFKTYISSRKDLQLSDSIIDDDGPFPKNTVLQILRVMQMILENCHNKSSFGCQEHFKLLLTSTDPEVLVATLETLSALVKINPSKLHVSGKLIGCGSINSCLLSLAQGWGSKEEGLGLFSCVVANERSQEEGLSLFPSDVGNDYDKSQYRLGTTLHYEFHVNSSGGIEQNSGRRQSSDICVIHIPNLHLQKKDDLAILKQCINQYSVPPENRFSLLTRIRYARSFLSPKTCRLYSRICLLAFIVLVQSNDAHEELASFFANEPDFTNDLIKLFQFEDSAPGSIRTLAMLALGAQLAAYSSSHERARLLSGSSIISSGGNRTVFLSVLQKAVLSLNNSSDRSALSFLDALLQFYLLHVISSSSSGVSTRGSGIVPTLLPLLQDVESAHMGLVCSAVKTVQKLMDYSSAEVSLFTELGGVELLAHRLEIEVHRIVGTDSENSISVIRGGISKCDDNVFSSQKQLIKAFLKALGSATYASGSSTRSQNSYEKSLPSSLSLIFRNVDKFGGEIYYSAVTVMSEIIHKDPTCFSMLHDLGLPDAFLSSVLSGILPSSKALTCIPSGLGAICLNAKGLEAVKETTALRFLVETFTTKKYLLAMNEGVVPLSNAVEELLRHASGLRNTGIDIIIEIIEKLSLLGNDICTGSPSNVDGDTKMETDSQNKDNSGHEDLLDGTEQTNDGVSNEQFFQLCIFHVMVLVHRVMENSENCRLFVEKKGIEALMKLLLQPSIAQSPEGMAIALHSTVVFKGFTQHHSTPLAHAFCSSLRDHLKKALSGFSSIRGLVAAPDSSIFSHLFVVEFLLFLAASKDTRWVTALLAEFGNGSNDVLEDIGQVHQEVLWQIALIDDAMLELEDDSCVSSGGSQRLDLGTSEAEEPRFNSFRQFLDPLMRRRASAWSVESQFYDLVSLYRDLGRATGLQHRLGMDEPSNLQLGSGHQLQPSRSLGTGAVGRMEENTRQSCYSSCCDMMRSLSVHISHMFLELGKVLSPSHRRDDSPNVSSSAKSVVSTFASIAGNHLNFAGHVNHSTNDVSISSKCRYLGKVVSFIDSILKDRPESYNPILLNCFFGHGVIQAILTTFEATSQLLFDVSRMPTSPMETDDGNLNQKKDEIDNSWIYSSLTSYGTLLDHLVTSSFIISPFTKHLLCQPITEGTVPLPQDAETFVKVLQRKVLKAVLPIWSHPHFTDCRYLFVIAIISIIRHIYSGVEVKNSNANMGAQIVGPPPDESVILIIIEMGFSRSRAEEALRQVGTNSVEMAMEWLFSHPEEAQEDDELARALAMSLGSSGTTIKDEEVGNVINFQEEETVQLPTLDELLLTCTRLLRMMEPIVFPVRDLLVMICSQNDGHHRSKVVTFFIDQVKVCSSVSDINESKLSAYLHVLALILHEDQSAREVAAKNGLVKISLDLLSGWIPVLHGVKRQVPKWLTTAFLALERMLQVDPKLSSEIPAPEQLKKDDVTNKITIVSDENKSNSFQSTLGLKRFIDTNEQKRLIEIACRCIQNKLPSETMHVVLQLCASLTKVHSIALTFLDAGGLRSLLSLPMSSLFSGFDNVSSAIVRHILEDPQTLQQAMEAEIRHVIVSAPNRHPNGRLTPRNFLQNLASVISRDPLVFMKAAQSVCQIEMAGERPHIVLLKDREKDKCKEKDKEKSPDKDKHQVADANDHGKPPDSSTKNVKAHRKPPQSFVSVIELLLDFVINFVPSPKDDGLVDGQYPNPSTAEMEVDSSENKGKGVAIGVVSEGSMIDKQEASSSLAKTVFVLKLLSEILSTYASSVHVLLRRDGEFSNRHYVPHHGPSANCSGGIFHHILHKFVPYPGRSKKDKKVDCDWRHKLASRASQFLVTSSTRSTEGRRRVFMEIRNVLNDFVDPANDDRVPDYHIHAYVDLLNDILTARLPTGPFISAEASAIFIDVGLVRSLTRTLQVLDLDLADSHKIVTGIVKALELVTKEYVQSPDACSGKGVNSVRPTSNHGQPGGQDNGGERIQSLGTTSRSNQNEVAPDRVEPSDAVQTRGSSGSVTDDMEQEQDINGGFPPETDDDFMHEASEEAGGIHNGVATVEIGFDVAHNVQGNSVDEDDDEEMSGEEEDEDEVDEEENNDLDEDDAHHMSHLDTDQDEHEIDEDDYDEDILEDEDEDDEDDENGVILRLEEGINGIDVFDHIRVYGRENHLLNDPSYLMPEELLGSRRHGRTTSIYSLLGRNSDSGAPLQHQLLVEPSSLHPISLRQSGDAIFRDESLENTSSRLDSVFRSLRSGRHGHRFNTWVDDGQQRSGSNVQQMPPGMEELLISQLRRPAPGQPLNQDKPTAEPQDKVEMGQLWESSEREEAPAPSNLNGENVVIRSPNSAVMDSTGNADVEPIGNDFIRGREVSNVESQATDMQYDRSDAVVRDAEAVSQGSSGSGATLGESLRSLEVEIGSADGHDDGGERPLGDLQPTRMRRVPVSLGNATPVASRDVSLQSVNEVPPHPNQVVDQSGSAEDQQINRTTDSGSIDPAFLDALPEELRAEVISAQQSQAAEPSTDPPQSVEEIDPEFLAALPPDIRAEVLAQQQAQRLQQSQEFEGQPVEMDTVSIIATFPSDLREEVLLTSSDAILANLTPALVAEANMLRERVAHRYHSRALLGMYQRNRRGESSRRVEAVGSGLDRAGTIGPHRSVGGKLSEADGVPLVDNEALRSMIRLLRVVQLPYKSQLQKLFLNLCAHPETRTSLVQILMDMLILDILGPFTASNGALEPSYRLYGRQNSVAYSRPQFFDGLPPLVSRRILESLYYLARSHPEVARLLLHLQLPRPPVDSPGQMRGKAVVAVEHDQTETKEQKGEFSIVLLLNLLNQPLYLRSSAHLEQLLYLLGIVIDNAKHNSRLSNKSVIAPSDQPSSSQSTKTETSLNAGTVGTSAVDVKSSGSDDHNSENDTLPILLSLPQTELRLLCSLLARESLSENAYNLVAEVLKKLVTIAPRHCHLFITELADSVQRLSRSAMNELHTYGEGEKELLSTSSTDGTAILRVLQALSSLVSILVEKQNEKEPHLFPDVDYKSILSQVWSINSVLEPLWTELSTCISKIESCSDFAPGLSTSSGRLASTSTDAVPLPVPPGTQNILPYIESFFVTCGKLCPGQSVASPDLGTANTSDVEDATTAGGQKFPGSTTRTDEKHVAFVKFSEKHRKLLNAFIRQNPGLLDKSLVLMLKVPRLIDFDNKRAHFRSKMKYQHDHHHNPLRISVRRAYILEDSYNQLRLRSAQDLKGRLTVHFQGEEGIDAGGLTREWFQSLSRVIFDKGALLFTTVGNESTFQPNPNSNYQTEHLSYFKFVGRVVGKALFDGQLLDVHFTRSFYKHILGVKVTYHDIEAIDPHYFRNLKWMLENDVSDVLDLTFSIDADEEKLILYERAEVTDYELIPGGRNIKVTEENKHEYVNLVTEHRLTTAIRPQINAFMEGFNELILQDLISIFNDKELELLVSGLPDIDLDDMRANTEYSGYSAASPVIQWFWEIVQGFTKEDKARLLQFVTGTSKVPLEGFSALHGISGSQRFQIHKAYGSPNHLPSAHTCFNQLDLPEYPSKNQLQERLLLAIHEASEGFGFG